MTGEAVSKTDRTAEFAAKIAAEADRQIARFRQAARGLHPRTCPVCDYHGMFTAFGQPPRFDARCPSCNALERHRLFHLFCQRRDPFGPTDRVLHFAPDKLVTDHVQPRVALYETSDLAEGRRVTHRVNIEATGLPDAGYTRIICSHVLEHVDDAKALSEMYRMLAPGGIAFFATPVIEGWAHTYEDASVDGPKQRLVHFGQTDHVRIYGRDLRIRIRAAGFTLGEFTAVEPDVLTYGLMRGETLFIATKPIPTGDETWSS